MNRWTWHGGGLDAARAHFGGDDWLDLSTGINPHSWQGVEGIHVDWRRLPDEGDLRALEKAAGEYFGLDPDHVCAVPGTEVGLRLAGEMLNVPAFHLQPSYRTHAEMLPGGRNVARARLCEADGATLILANPNNPDGAVFARSELLGLLERRGAGWLAVDEAFADAIDDASIANDVREDRRLLVFRSFGKFFGLAGLRLGFVLGPRAWLEDLRRRLGAWPVSTAALAIGARAYGDPAWIADMRRQLQGEAAALDDVLIDAGFRPVGNCPLFRLIDVEDAGALFERLARCAILTRPFADRPRWLRLGLPGSDTGLARLQAALGDG